MEGVLWNCSFPKDLLLTWWNIKTWWSIEESPLFPFLFVCEVQTMHIAKKRAATTNSHTTILFTISYKNPSLKECKKFILIWTSNIIYPKPNRRIILSTVELQIKITTNGPKGLAKSLGWDLTTTKSPRKD